jgi:hypothetical protein
MPAHAQRYFASALGFATVAVWVTAGLRAAVACLVASSTSYLAVAARQRRLRPVFPLASGARGRLRESEASARLANGHGPSRHRHAPSLDESLPMLAQGRVAAFDHEPSEEAAHASGPYGW